MIHIPTQIVAAPVRRAAELLDDLDPGQVMPDDQARMVQGELELALLLIRQALGDGLRLYCGPLEGGMP
jgi:hypothetical protein